VCGSTKKGRRYIAGKESEGGEVEKGTIRRRIIKKECSLKQKGEKFREKEKRAVA